MKKCPYCGKEYPDQASICASDHARLESDGLTPNSAAEAFPAEGSICATDQAALESDAPIPSSTSDLDNNARKRFRPEIVMAIYGAILLGVMPIILARIIPLGLGPGILLFYPEYLLIDLLKAVYLLPSDIDPNGLWGLIIAIILNSILGAIFFVGLGTLFKFLVNDLRGK
jgi:hypothetical protein